MAIAIAKQLAECGGAGMAKHKNVILPAIIGTLSDAKVMNFLVCLEVSVSP